MMASMITGIGFPNSGLGAVHGLSLPLGGHYNIPHGVANAIMLPHVMKFNLGSRPEKFSEIAEALGASGRSPEASVDAVMTLRKQVGIPVLSSFNMKEEDIPSLARDSVGRNTNCVTNPREVTEKDAAEMYSMALREQY
jgi:alcohol dehydrogenase class IV